MRRRIARWLQAQWYARERPALPLRAAAALYAAAARKRGGRPPARPPCPVIVVGNLVAGGSGKTPVVEAIASRLGAAGLATAIVSRGYGGRAGDGPVRVAPGHSAADVGDEALELAVATGLPMWVGRRRAAALAAAVADGAEVVVADDGLQHGHLPRSFEVCVVDGRRGFGNGRLLPAGPLRESPARLKEVDLVLIKGAAQPASRLPDGVRFDLESGSLQARRPGARPPGPGTTVDAVAGIADPEPFFAELERRGWPLRRHALADHEPIDARWLADLRGPVVLTRKDAMRLGERVRDDVFVLPVRARLSEATLQRIERHVREFRR
jgi:tetraacyldisaccharide 4'-kinase